MNGHVNWDFSWMPAAVLSGLIIGALISSFLF